MNWEDEGYLLNKSKFRENANIVNVFTLNHGRVSGIVYGGTSRKVKNYLQVGNKIFLVHSSKNTNKSGYLKTEIIEAISPKYFDDKKRSYSILSISQLLNTLLPEYQSYKKIYISFSNFIKNLDHNNWAIIYIYFELNLIKELGFGFSLQNESSNDPLVKIKIDNVFYQIPKFILSSQIPKDLTDDLILKSLIFTRSLLLNKFYLPNNLAFPKSRLIFENLFS